MSDDFTDLETELKQLRPRALRPAPLARLAAASPDAKSESRAGVIVWLWPALGAAAAVALMLLGVAHFSNSPDDAPGRAPTFAASPSAPFGRAARGSQGGLRLTPVSATNTFYGADVERTVRMSDDVAAQQVRLRYVDTVTWRDPQRGATFQWSVPREEVVMMPVRAD